MSTCCHEKTVKSSGQSTDTADFLFSAAYYDPTHGPRHGIKEAARFLIQLDPARFQPLGFTRG